VPTAEPSLQNTDAPVYSSTGKPSATFQPSSKHTLRPTFQHTDQPSFQHTDQPTPQYTLQLTPHPTDTNIFVSGIWKQIERVDVGAACCVKQTLAFSSNKRVLAVSNAWSGAGGFSNAGSVTIFRRDFIETNKDDGTLQTAVPTDHWVKVGDMLHGQSSEERFGSNIALSGDGSLLVVSNHSYIHTYRVYNSYMQKMNDDLSFISPGKIALSSDGTVLAVTNYTSSMGSVKTYRFTGNRWVAFGGTITTNSSYGRVPSIGISGDGGVLAFGISSAGAVAYYLSPINNTWGQFASWSFGDGFGASLALSDDGKVLAVGQRGNVKTFDLDGPSRSSRNRGHDIPYFENGGSYIEHASLSLSSDGGVLILGNYDEDYSYEIDSKYNVGIALAYRFDDDLKWRQFGGDLKETNSSVEFGHAVALSADGTELAVAASCDDGCTFIYRLE